MGLDLHTELANNSHNKQGKKRKIRKSEYLARIDVGKKGKNSVPRRKLESRFFQWGLDLSRQWTTLSCLWIDRCCSSKGSQREDYCRTTLFGSRSRQLGRLWITFLQLNGSGFMNSGRIHLWVCEHSQQNKTD
jgi:hypothetical protein